MSDADYEYDDICLCRHHVLEHREAGFNEVRVTGEPFAECVQCGCVRFTP